MNEQIPESKINRFSKAGIDYIKELERNAIITDKAIQNLKRILVLKEDEHYQELAQKEDFKHCYFISDRLSEILASTTDDLCRYASYHKIQIIDGYLSVSPSTRASFFVKWICLFKPCILDKFAYLDRPTNKNDDDLLSDTLRYSNEIFSLIIASIILNIKDSRPKTIPIINILSKDELRHLIYKLRYGVQHEDSYNSFFHRVYFENNKTNQPSDERINNQ